jgi:TolB protein
MTLRLVYCLSLVGALCVSPSRAQESDRRLDITVEGGLQRINIAVPGIPTTGGAGDAAEEVLQTLRKDLDFSGYFNVIDPSLYRLVPPPDGGTVRFDDWRSIGADALVDLRLQAGAGRIDLEARLYDNDSQSLLFARRYGGKSELLRRVAHQLADDLVRHYTGQSGVAMTRIAFVSKYGEGKEIYLMDYDGHRIRRLTTTATINLAPAWSPNGGELAFMSWRSKQPGVFVISKTGELGHLATVGGELSSAPEWSPDGRRLAYTSDIDGNTEIYVLDRSTGRNTRLTRNAAIDTAPAFSPNGREIAFTSDRTGTPQVYIMDAEGLNVRRVSWTGSYNDSAAWWPRGDRLAFVSRIDGRFDVMSLDLATDKVTRLTWGEGNNENPRWSPDGRHIVFASNREGSYDIYTMGADGSEVRRLTRGGDSFTPDWSR